jgi:hypothetical protein
MEMDAAIAAQVGIALLALIVVPPGIAELPTSLTLNVDVG